MMFRKITVLLIMVMTITCILCGCGAEKNPNATATAVVTNTATTEEQTPETGNKDDLTVAGFDFDKVKVGDKISVFTVSEVDVKKLDDGTLASARIKLSGSLAVRGSYILNADNSSFTFTDEYSGYIPFPNNAANKLDAFYIARDKMIEIYGDNDGGYAAIIIEEYLLTYSSEDGEWHAFAESFSKDENEYAIMQ